MAPFHRRPRRAVGALLAAATAALTIALPNLSAAQPSGARAAPAPVRYEAESAVISEGAVESNHDGYSGSGFVNFDVVTGAYVEFTVDAAQAGPARLDFR
ncbi:cellulase family glycosylhydrolase, partial [Streptomyces tendae]